MAPPRSQSVKPTIIKARALYAFQANSSNELSLKVGDLIDVVERGPSGGWSKGVHGAFPTDYVEFISGDKVMEAIFSTLVPQKEKEINPYLYISNNIYYKFINECRTTFTTQISKME
jgi:hypothetical protein